MPATVWQIVTARALEQVTARSGRPWTNPSRRRLLGEHAGYEHSVIVLIHHLNAIPAAHLRGVERLICELQGTARGSGGGGFDDGDADADGDGCGRARAPVFDP